VSGDDEISGHVVRGSLEYHVLLKNILKIRVSVLFILVVY
jgi:hypothetical protein